MDNFVSIIIPALNVSKYIDECLSSLAALDYPKNKLEIIVVDNGSKDNTVEIARNYNVKVIVKTNCTISALRNEGERYSQGNILAFIDADCIASKNWLTNAVELLQGDRIGAVGCWYDLPSKPSLVEQVWDILTSERRRKIGHINWVPSGNFIISKSVFNRINGFNESLITSEDVDICNRIYEVGFIVFSHPKLTVTHLGNPKNLKQFFWKEFWRGKGVLQNFINSFPQLKFNKAVLFAIFDLICILSLFLGIVIAKIYGIKILLILSILCLISAPFIMSVKIAIYQRRWFYLFHLTILFFIYGISRALSFVSFSVWKNILNHKPRTQ